jgi:hypothetical protein
MDNSHLSYSESKEWPELANDKIKAFDYRHAAARYVETLKIPDTQYIKARCFRISENSKIFIVKSYRGLIPQYEDDPDFTIDINFIRVKL